MEVCNNYHQTILKIGLGEKWQCEACENEKKTGGNEGGGGRGRSLIDWVVSIVNWQNTTITSHNS